MKHNFVTSMLGGLIGAALLILLLGATSLVSAQGRSGYSTPDDLNVASSTVSTTFTYQGQLKNGSNPVNGSCSMAFRLYDDPSAGSLIGSPITLTNVPISNGLFTVGLNFGSNAFTGNARWLSLSIDQCPGGGFTMLSPRQMLSAVPYALYSAAPWVTNGSNLYYNAGNVGIGTGAPTTKLTLQGNELIKGEDNPIARGVITTNLSGPTSVYVSGKYAYVTSYDNGALAIFDISNPNNIVAKGTTNENLGTPNGPTSVVVAGHYAYVTSVSNHTLAIYAVSDPNTIVALGTTTTNLSVPVSVYVSGKYAYVADEGNNTLAIFDVSDPNNIVAKGTATTNLNNPVSVYVSGRYAYVVSSANNTLAVFDVHNPNNILPEGVITTNLSHPQSVYVSDGYAYVASSSNNTLAVFDVSELGHIVAKGFTTANLNYPNSVYVSGKYAYVTSSTNNRLAVFDVSDPNNIVAKGFTTSNLNEPASVYVSGKYAYVASFGNNTLASFEVNNLEAPTIATGNLSSGGLDVTDNAIVGNNLDVQGGLNVGPGGALIDGPIASPMWHSTKVIAQAGPLPITSAAFTTNGGTLIIFASGSGYSSSGGNIGMSVELDGTWVGGVVGYTNEGNSHKAFVANQIIVTGIPAGSHTISLVPQGVTLTNSDDAYDVAVLEEPY